MTAGARKITANPKKTLRSGQANARPWPKIEPSAVTRLLVSETISQHVLNRGELCGGDVSINASPKWKEKNLSCVSLLTKKNLDAHIETLA